MERAKPARQLLLPQICFAFSKEWQTRETTHPQQTAAKPRVGDEAYFRLSAARFLCAGSCTHDHAGLQEAPAWRALLEQDLALCV